MIKRFIAALLSVVLCLSALPAFAEQSINVRTPLYGASDAQRENMAIALRNIDGITVPGGQKFSFNNVVGPRTRSYGYVTAPNGRGVNVTGGGVGQVASTVYLALRQMNAGVYIDELHTYGNRFTGSYVSGGSEAVLVDYSAGSDFVFTNYTDDMYLQMWMTDSYLYCTISFRESGNAGADNSISWDSGWNSENSWNSDANDWNSNWNNSFNSYRRKIASSYIYLGGTDNLLSNVALAAASINDTVLPGGAVFSFNSIVGPREERYGYKAAVNGRGSRVIGGGVAQVASAVWLAVKNLDCVAVMEKSTYGKKYNQTYVANSNDAILTDYKAGTDFSFRNSGASQLTICTYVSSGVLYCDIYEN